jgi:UDP-glucuronate 4-epimerase
MTILVTGAAGFIGSAVCMKLLERGEKVVGIDNHNDYYDVDLKQSRLKKYLDHSGYQHFKIDICNNNKLVDIFDKFKFKFVINLAAQAGVGYSLINPSSYIESNIIGFANIIENCKKFKVKHLVYASTSSVYGANTKMPFSENESANHPLSLYAATKRSNELIAHTYSYLFHLPTTGLRFFTVYGPWGRPDMALFKFTKNILTNEPINLFNHGKHTRDFTYIDDIVEGVIRVVDHPATPNKQWNSDQPDPATSKAPWKIYNIGNNKPVDLLDYVHALETNLGKKANIHFLPLQPGDVPDTCADVKNLNEKFDYKPSTSIDDGISNFVKWYKNYYKF